MMFFTIDKLLKRLNRSNNPIRAGWLWLLAKNGIQEAEMYIIPKAGIYGSYDTTKHRL